MTTDRITLNHALDHAATLEKRLAELQLQLFHLQRSYRTLERKVTQAQHALHNLTDPAPDENKSVERMSVAEEQCGPRPDDRTDYVPKNPDPFF